MKKRKFVALVMALSMVITSLSAGYTPTFAEQTNSPGELYGLVNDSYSNKGVDYVFTDSNGEVVTTNKEWVLSHEVPDFTDYLRAVAKYEEDTKYDAKLKENYEQDMLKYQEDKATWDALKEEWDTYNALYAQYEADYEAYSNDHDAWLEEKAQYEADMRAYEEALAEYNRLKREYDESVQAYTSAKEAYDAEVAQYEQDLEAYNTAKAEHEQAMADYEVALSQYEEDYAQYEIDIEAYNEAYQAYQQEYEQYLLDLEDYNKRQEEGTLEPGEEEPQAPEFNLTEPQAPTEPTKPEDFTMEAPTEPAPFTMTEPDPFIMTEPVKPRDLRAEPVAPKEPIKPKKELGEEPIKPSEPNYRNTPKPEEPEYENLFNSDGKYKPDVKDPKLIKQEGTDGLLNLHIFKIKDWVIEDLHDLTVVINPVGTVKSTIYLEKNKEPLKEGPFGYQLPLNIKVDFGKEAHGLLLDTIEVYWNDEKVYSDKNIKISADGIIANEIKPEDISKLEKEQVHELRIIYKDMFGREYKESSKFTYNSLVDDISVEEQFSKKPDNTVILPYLDGTPEISWVITAKDIEPIVEIAVMSESGTKLASTSTIKGTVGEEQSANLSLPLSTVKDNEVLIFRATNASGYYVDFSSCYKVDAEVPQNITASTGSFVDSEGSLFFADEVHVNVSSTSDDVERLVLIKGSNQVDIENNTFNIPHNTDISDWKVKAIDWIGNETQEFALNDLIGANGTLVLIDTGEPSVSIDLEGDSWYATPQSAKVSFKDNLKIKSAKVTINGFDAYSANSGLSEELSTTVNTGDFEVNEDGSYTVVAEVEDMLGRKSSTQVRFFVDSTAPHIERFNFVTDGNKEGAVIGGSAEYGFYFKEGASVEVYVSDGTVSSGLGYLYYKISGSDDYKSVPIENGVARFDIPNDFKGFISAYPVDLVGNKGVEDKPSGVISESSNYAVTNNIINVTFPETSVYDDNGYRLYGNDIEYRVTVTNEYAGVKSASVNGSATSVSNNGDVSGSMYGTAWNSNLVTQLQGDFTLQGNSDGLEVVISLTDRVGHSDSRSYFVSIDKDAPVVAISWDTTSESGIYPNGRVATVTVSDRNLDVSGITLSGNYGSVSNWVRSGDTYTATISFSADGEYDFSVVAVDKVGNTSNQVNSGSFTIDSTPPVISVVFDNNNVSNGRYYNNVRTATITVTDTNFSPNNMSIMGGSIGGWSSNGNTHTANVVFSTDGTYQLRVSGSDAAGNTAGAYESEEFVIDLTKPEVVFENLTEGTAYHKDVSFNVLYSDSNIDYSKSIVTLFSSSRGDVTLSGVDGLRTFLNDSKDGSWDGYYTVNAIIYDLAGNITEASRTFAINRKGSNFNFTNKDFAGKYMFKAEDIVITETSVEPIVESSIRIYLGDSKFIDLPHNKVKVSEKQNPDGTYTYTYTLDKSLFEDGSYNIQLYTRTASGYDNSSIAQEYSFVIDTVAPRIIVGGVDSYEVYTDKSKVMSIDIDDASGLGTLRVLIDGVEADVKWENGTAYVTIPAKDGVYEVEIFAVDKAGNTSTVRVHDFEIISDWFSAMWRSDWFKGGVIGIPIAILALILFLIAKRRKEEEEEADLHSSSSATGTSSSSSGATDDDSTTTLLNE